MKTRIIIGVLGLILTGIILAVFNLGPEWSILLATVPIVAANGPKTAKELKEQRSQLLDQMQGILDKSKEEKRSLTPDDNTKIDDLNAQLDLLNVEIARMERMEANMALRAGDYINGENRRREEQEVRNYSFLTAMRQQMKGKLEGFELEMHQEAVKEARANGVEIEGIGVPSIVLRKSEKRDMSAAGGSNGSEGGVMVPTMLQDGFIDTLASKMVLREMGATFLDGLIGNVDIARKTSTTTAAWEGELDAGAEASPAWDKISLTPNRLGAYIQLSKRLIHQTSRAAEGIAKDDIIRAIRLAVETEAIVGTNLSTGILSTSGIGSVVGGTTGAAPAWSHITALEKEVAVDDADIGSLGYLTNPKVRNKLKNVAVGTDMRMILAPNEKELNGYRMGITNLVPSTLDKGASTGVCSAIIFGNFNDLIIANWAGLDIVIDPYTDAKNSLVNVIVNSWWDVAVRRAQSFAAMLDVLTS
jgi:HK97 family phage major capsid protein